MANRSSSILNIEVLYLLFSNPKPQKRIAMFKKESDDENLNHDVDKWLQCKSMTSKPFFHGSLIQM